MTYRIEWRSAFSDEPDEWEAHVARLDRTYISVEAARAELPSLTREDEALGLEPLGIEYRVAKLDGIADTPLGDPIEIWLPV